MFIVEQSNEHHSDNHINIQCHSTDQELHINLSSENHTSEHTTNPHEHPQPLPHHLQAGEKIYSQDQSKKLIESFFSLKKKDSTRMPDMSDNQLVDKDQMHLHQQQTQLSQGDHLESGNFSKPNASNCDQTTISGHTRHTNYEHSLDNTTIGKESNNMHYGEFNSIKDLLTENNKSEVDSHSQAIQSSLDQSRGQGGNMGLNEVENIKIEPDEFMLRSGKEVMHDFSKKAEACLKIGKNGAMGCFTKNAESTKQAINSKMQEMKNDVKIGFASQENTANLGQMNLNLLANNDSIGSVNSLFQTKVESVTHDVVKNEKIWDEMTWVKVESDNKNLYKTRKSATKKRSGSTSRDGEKDPVVTEAYELSAISIKRKKSGCSSKPPIPKSLDSRDGHRRQTVAPSQGGSFSLMNVASSSPEEHPEPLDNQNGHSPGDNRGIGVTLDLPTANGDLSPPHHRRRTSNSSIRGGQMMDRNSQQGEPTSDDLKDSRGRIYETRENSLADRTSEMSRSRSRMSRRRLDLVVPNAEHNVFGEPESGEDVMTHDLDAQIDLTGDGYSGAELGLGRHHCEVLQGRCGIVGINYIDNEEDMRDKGVCEEDQVSSQKKSVYQNIDTDCQMETDEERHNTNQHSRSTKQSQSKAYSRGKKSRTSGSGKHKVDQALLKKQHICETDSPSRSEFSNLRSVSSATSSVISRVIKIDDKKLKEKAKKLNLLKAASKTSSDISAAVVNYDLDAYVEVKPMKVNKGPPTINLQESNQPCYPLKNEMEEAIDLTVQQNALEPDHRNYDSRVEPPRARVMNSRLEDELMILRPESGYDSRVSDFKSPVEVIQPGVSPRKIQYGKT